MIAQTFTECVYDFFITHIKYDATRSRGYCTATTNLIKLEPFLYRGELSLTNISVHWFNFFLYIEKTMLQLLGALFQVDFPLNLEGSSLFIALRNWSSKTLKQGESQPYMRGISTY